MADALGDAFDRGSTVPFSPLFASGRVGADYLERHGVPTAGAVDGEMDDLGAYARPGFDPADVHPAVRRFYEHTGEYALTYEVTWHPGFRLGAALVSPLTSRFQQLNLPGTNDAGPRRLASRFVALDPAADLRPGARAWIRTDTETGEAVFVALYASHERNGTRYVNIAVPLPRSNLSTVLSVNALPTALDGAGLELTTTTDGDDEGLYLVTPLGAVALPLDQTFRVWPADAPDAPDAPATPSDATGDTSQALGGSVRDAGDRPAVVATHEMWVCGRQFLTVRYAGWRTDGID
ncbi:MAG: hypothetical protein ABEJ28_10660 [Salinigranum sp.]